MSNYVKTVDFAVKDGLTTGNPAKAGLGTQVDTEFNNIATAVATKLDSSSYTAADVLAKVLTLDGASSTLDADTVRTITPLVGSTTIDFGSIASGALSTTSFTVTGAVVGNPVVVGVSTSASGLVPYAQVTGSNTVSVGFFNCTSGALDPASTVFRVVVLKS